MNKLFKTFILLFFFSFICSANSDAKSVNGQWQYLILRGDTNGVGGSMTNRNCPFYVGYFSLDYRKAKRDSKGKFQLGRDDHSLFRSNKIGPMYAMGANNYEIKGSYTPYDTNKFCKKPLTATQHEKAKIQITEVSPNGKKIKWYTDFLYGSNRANAVWEFDGTFNGKNSIRGRLKAFVCRGEGRTNCQQLNTAKFVAKRVKSIQEASKKPLYSKQLTPFQEFVNSILPNTYDSGGVFKEEMPYPEAIIDYDGTVKGEYIRSNIKAVMPALSQSYTHGIAFCQQQGGSGSPCELCKPVDCNGQTPTSKEYSGCCFGSSGYDICQCKSCPCIGDGCAPGSIGKSSCV